MQFNICNKKVESEIKGSEYKYKNKYSDALKVIDND